jgi:hypothetical protein
LTSALAGHSGAIKPGDTVWERGGDYDFTDPILSVSGLVGLIGGGVDDIDGKIIFRVYNPTVVGTDRRQWLTVGPDGVVRATAIGTGDPSQTERMHLRATQSTAAPSAGAVTVNGSHSVNATTISLLKVTNSQALLAGHQLTIGTDRYLVTAPVTLVAGTPTTVSVAAPNAAKSGGEAVTLILNHSNIDTIQLANGTKFIWFWDWESGQILKARTTPGYAGACWSLFNARTDGVKFINNLIHDYGGSNHFVEDNTGDIEGYGNITMRTGANGTNDGGGHDWYLHHNALWTPSFAYVLGTIIEDQFGFSHEVTTAGTSGATQPTWNAVVGGTTTDNTITWTNRRKGSAQARYEANVMLSSYSLQMQLYDADPNPVTHTLWKGNISINAGQLCTDANIGGVDADMYVIGGGTTGTIRSLKIVDNFGFIGGAKGSRAFNVSEGGGISGDGNEVLRNYMMIGGMGFSAFYVGAFAAAGQLTHRDNTYVVKAPAAGVGNGKCVEIQTNGGAQFTWGPNKYYRALGNSQDCGAETGSPTAFKDLAGGCRTLAQFLADCGFAGDLVLPAPTETHTFCRRADKYQAGRGYAIYFNHAGLSTIPICLLGLLQPGDQFVAHDIRDTLAGMRGQSGTPVIGTAAAPATLPPDGIVNFPNTQVAEPAPTGALQNVGLEVPAPDTAPTFNVFLIQRIAPRLVTHEVEQRRLAVGAF